MFCGKCGASLPDGAVKCSECGAPVKIRPEAADLRKTGQTFFKAPETDELGSPKEAADRPSAEPEKTGNKAETRTEAPSIHLIGEEIEEGSAERRRGEAKASSGDSSAVQNGEKKAAASSSSRRSNKKKSASGSGAQRKTGKKSSSKPSSEKPKEESREEQNTGKKASGPVREERVSKSAPDETKTAGPAATEAARPVRTAMPAMSREEYLESLPLAEKIRRRVQASLHRYEEAADARKMKDHLERASKYYNVEPESEEKTLIPGFAGKAQASAPVKRAPRPISSDEIREEIEKQAERERAEKVRVRLAAAESAAAQQTAAEEKTAGKPETAVKPETVEKPAAVEKPETAVKPEAAEKPKTAWKPAAAEVSAEPSDKETVKETVLESPEPAAAEESPAASGTGEEAPAPEPVRNEPADGSSDPLKAPSAEELLDAKKPQETAEEDKSPAAEVTGSDRNVSAQDRPAVEAGTGLSDQEILALARKALADREASALTAREQQLEDARIVRRYQEDMPDHLDQVLGRYGLSKDAAVRLATLFLIAVLSMVYVLGRGRQPSPLEDVPVAGDGLTGAPAYADPGAGETAQEETAEETPEEAGAAEEQSEQ